jgi:prolyl-tRNA editing enzyme YbaK/EbsC (Cys-tRNA(Pro) deacylase)
LTGEGIQFEELQHAPTRTSEESAIARGEPLSNGGKALLLKVDNEFGLFVLPADRRLDSRAIRDVLGARRTRFASAEELMELTSLVPGSVPPFGEPLLPFSLHLDSMIPKNERIAFNAGSLEHSFLMSVESYLTAAEPKEIFAFSTE